MTSLWTFVRRIILRALPGILFAVATASSAYAQVPAVPCREGQELDPYEIWSDVRSDDGAKAFLHAEYKKFQSPMEFAVWLSCQDFRVSVLDGPIGSGMKAGEILISAGFLIAPKNRPALWGGSWLDRILKKHAHTFEIVIAQDGNMREIRVGLTSK